MTISPRRLVGAHLVVALAATLSLALSAAAGGEYRQDLRAYAASARADTDALEALTSAPAPTPASPRTAAGEQVLEDIASLAGAHSTVRHIEHEEGGNVIVVALEGAAEGTLEAAAALSAAGYDVASYEQAAGRSTVTIERAPA